MVSSLVANEQMLSVCDAGVGKLWAMQGVGVGGLGSGPGSAGSEVGWAHRYQWGARGSFRGFPGEAAGAGAQCEASGPTHQATVRSVRTVRPGPETRR